MEPRDRKELLPSELDELSQVAEALVFGADEPVSGARIAEVFSEIRGDPRPAPAEVDQAIELLNGAYEQAGHAIRVYKWADGFRMATVPEVAPFLKAFLDDQRSRRLSRSLLEALAVVAYRQPVTKPEVDFIRGVDSDYALRKLMEMDMVDVIGRSDAVGRPLLYGTTSAFLETFGLENLETLPNLREVEDLLNDPAFNSEKARILLRQSLFDADQSTDSEDADASAGKSDGAGASDGGGDTDAPGSSVGVDNVVHRNGNGINGTSE